MECHFEKGKWGDNDDDDGVLKKMKETILLCVGVKMMISSFPLSDIYYN